MAADPAAMGALRMRRFYVRRLYVRPSLRRHGIGRKMALSLLEKARSLECQAMVNAGTADASVFWETLGFMPDPCNGHTHIFHPRNS